MAKQLNVNLAFTADTGKAKAQIQDLQNQLTKLVTTTNNQKLSVDLDNKGINEAISSVAELQAHLRKATNQKTGNLDFSKLNDSLKKSNKSLIEYGDSLRQLGPEGQKAFQTLVSSVTSAEIPMRRVNNTLNEMWTTMKNTARWQISSSIMHGFMGSVQSAYGYAKRLDESLNNIRIVTGQNTDQMAAFAEKANKAAKALSATTTQYTDAALIYYQQGLNDQEVQDRADITIKMAHASGQSAEIVSDQLTAIWNNFAKGGEDLEHFADVMTALGAATASSSDEIAGGLEKFASIADMIGLSYEYAASALATITATTRQSEDVVGTALKTIFARIQGLKLGDTLDDGTDLNKYSEALQKVGISIFEQNGELKDMDNILDEMGAKWDTLSKDQQVALAQTVAGVRQYNQLVSLMDNWDFMQENVELSNNADGTLDEQADIYAESWEAASNRVRAAAEDIYDSLLDDEFFITLLNGFEDVLTVVGKLIDGIGGLEGVFGAVGVVATKIFSKQLTQSLRDAKYSIKMMVDPEGVEQDRKDFLDYAAGTTKDKEFKTPVDKARSEVLRNQVELQELYLNNLDKMSEAEQEANQLLMERNKLLGEEKIKAEEKLYDSTNKKKDKAFDAKVSIAKKQGDIESPIAEQVRIRENNQKFSEKQKNFEAVIKTKLTLKDEIKEINDAEKALELLKQKAEEIDDAEFKGFVNGLTQADLEANNLDDTLAQVINTLNGAEISIEGELKDIVDSEDVEIVDEIRGAIVEEVEAQQELNEATERYNESQDDLSDKIEKSIGNQADWADHVIGTAEAIMSITTIISSLKATMETLQSPDISAEEKLEAVMIGLTTTIPMVISLLNSKTLATGLSMLATKLNAGAIVQEGLAENASIIARTKSIGLLMKEVALRALLNPYIAGAIILTTALAFAIKDKIEAQEADAKAAESAKKATEDLKTATEDAKSTLDSIVSDIDQYDNLVKALNDCEEGTEEWNEALQNVKDNIWDILQKYPELAKMDNLFNEDGTLNREVIDGYISQKKDNASNLQAAALSADARASKAQVVSNTTDLSRDFQKIFNDQNFLYSAKDGKAEIGESQGREFVNSLVNKINEEDLSLDEVNNEINSYIKSLNLTKEAENELRAEMVESTDGLYDLAKATKEAEAQMDNVSKLLADEVLGKDATEDQKNTYSEKYQEQENKAYQQYIDNKDKISTTTSRGDTRLLEMWQAAQKSLGTDYELASDPVIGEGDNLSIQYVGTDGEVKEMSYEAVAAAAAAGTAQTLAQEEIEVSLKDEMGDAGDSIMEGIDTDLLVSLGNTFDFADEKTQEIINTALEGATTLAEQEKIIADLLNNSLNKDQQEEIESKELISNASQKYDLDAEVLEKQAEQLMKVYEAEELTKVQATKLAIENQRMNKGVKDLIDNWEDWNKELKSGKKGTSDYAKMTTDLTKTIANLTGAAEDLELPDEFFESEKNLKLIEKAAKGSEQAIAELGVAVGKSTVEMMEMSAESIRFGEGTAENPFKVIDEEVFNNAKAKVLEGINELQAKVAAGEDLVGQSLDQIMSAGAEGSAEWIAALNEMAMATGMSVEEMNGLLSSMNLEANVTTTDIPQDVQVPVHKMVMDNIEKDPLTGMITSYTTRSIPMGTETHKGKISVAQISTDDSNPGAPKVNYIGNGSVSPTSSKPKGGGGGGGGGSKSKPAEKVKYTKKDEVVDRYKEIDDTLSDIEDTMSDINKLSDRLYGASRISQMEKEKKLLLQQADALKEKKRQAEDYLKGNAAKGIKGDKQELIDVGADVGITWEFGDDGDILNYTSAMEGLFNELHAAEAKMDGMATKEAQDEFKTNSIEPIEEKIEKVKDALSKYEDTKELIKDLDNQLQEAIWAWEDKNFEELEYKLELKLDIDDADLKHLDYLMNKWSDDFFKMAETAALMASPTGEYDQIEGYSNQLKNYREHELALDEKYANKEISQADYIEGLKNVRDGYYEQLEALNELDKTMLHYYEDTLSAASEELDDYTDHMEHLTGVLDHYLNLMDLLGKQKDFDALGDFLGGKAETTRDQLNVAKEYYDMLLEQKEETEREYNKAIRSGDKESIKFWQEQWDAIVDATDEAQEEMLSLTEAWVENMRAVIQNNMDKLAADLEKSLTGEFMNFDVLMDSFDKLNTRQEEYLTKTNQIYETNKLIRQASQKIDETDNKVAKQKMQNFITETKSLQENNQLSEYELEIQQAKYELLLAEIALEEAQNAKSTVRLSRDSEGNFGYVYTADQDAVDDAEQGLDDAKNRLYNLSLEGQQEYTEKYLQAQQSMYEELTELQQMFLDGELASEEEYQLRKEEIINHYYGENGILRTYSNLYNVAVQTDAAATADYWGKQYGAMTQVTDDWQVAVNEYLEEVEEETEEWADVSKQANRDVEGALKNSSKATKDLTDESDKLGKEIKNDLIPAMDEEFERVKDAIIAYDNERDAIRKMREEYEKYIETINKNIKKASEDEINKTDDDHFKKDYSLSALINAAEGDMDAAYKDIDKRNEKIKDDGNYSDKTSSTTKKKVDAVDKLSDSQKEAIASSLKYLKEQGKYTTEQVDIILKQNGASFATGGFTGAWGPEGKLAFLHEKELVLNQDDTSNLLKTISFIREIVSMIDSQASSANLGFLSTPGFSNAIDHNFEQTVSIYAEFPSATNHTEIEEAFNNLLNTASQYANRKE